MVGKLTTFVSSAVDDRGINKCGNCEKVIGRGIRGWSKEDNLSSVQQSLL